MLRLLPLLGLLAAVLLTPQPSFAAKADATCAGASVRAVASPTHSRVSPCVVKHRRVAVETTYYQNASKVGGTALAAFPEVRVRYGLVPRAELFYDASSEIAVSGERGSGVYYMTHPGLGARFEVARAGGVLYSLSAEGHPPLSALANLHLIPIFDAHAAANWSASGRNDFAAQAGYLNFETAFTRNQRSSAFGAFSATHGLNGRTWATMELGFQSHATWNARSQTSGIFSLQRSLSETSMMNLELGTAFNAAGNSKPHYLGFGFAVR
jgi:hypothetical protein